MHKLKCQNDKDMLFWGYFSNLVSLFTGILLLPFVINSFKTSELALYFIMQTLILLFSFLDIGFGPQLTKYVTYILSGANEITKVGLSQKRNSKVNTQLLNVVICIAVKFYNYLSIVCIFALSIVGVFYYAYSEVISEIKSDFFYIWIFFSKYIYLNSKFSYLLPYLSGFGYIIETRKISSVAKLIQFVASLVALKLGYGLIGVLFANIVMILTQVGVSLYFIYTENLNWEKTSFGVEEDRKIFFKMIYSAKYIGTYYISNLLLARGSLLIGGIFLTSEVMASYGLLVQVMTLVSTFSTVFSNVIQTKMLHYRMTNSSLDIKNKLSNSILSFLFLSVTASTILFFFGDYLLALIGSKSFLPVNIIVILYIVYSLLDTHYQLFNTFIATKNEFPFVKSSMLSSIFSVVCISLALTFTQNVIFLILIPLTFQIFYNFWFWPKWACNNLGDTYINVVFRR